jgi:hypothetical protein
MDKVEDDGNEERIGDFVSTLSLRRCQLQSLPPLGGPRVTGEVRGGVFILAQLPLAVCSFFFRWQVPTFPIIEK